MTPQNNKQADEQPIWDGRSCLSCKHRSLLIGKSGYVTCGNLECANPDFGSLLEAHVATLKAQWEREAKAQHKIDELSLVPEHPGVDIAAYKERRRQEIWEFVEQLAAKDAERAQLTNTKERGDV